MKNKLTTKIIAALLCLLLTATNFIFVATEAYALYEEGIYIAENETKTSNEAAQTIENGEEEDNSIRSRINLSINKTELSVINDLNEVELNIELKTNDQTKQLLYKNPKFIVQLPDNVRPAFKEELPKGEEYSYKVHIGASSLKFGEVEYGKKLVYDGQKNQLIFKLDGEQTEYTEVNALITVELKLVVDSLSPSTTSYFQVTYQNENDVDESNNPIQRTEKTVPVNINTGFGIVTNLNVSNYDGNGGVVSAGTISGGTAEAKLNINEENAKTVTVSGNIINNTKNNIQLKNAIITVNHKNYNGNETEILSRTIDLSSQLGANEQREFNSNNIENLNFEIPAYMYYNEVITVSYKATYMYSNKEYQVETIITLKTEEKDIVGDIFMSDNREVRVEIAKVLGDGSLLTADAKVKEGETVKYIVTVTNLTTNNMENVSVTMTRKNDNSKFYDYREYSEKGIQGETLYEKAEIDDVSKILNIGNISSKSNASVQYEIVAANDSANKELINSLNIKANGKNMTFNNGNENIDTQTVTIEDAKLKVTLQYEPQPIKQMNNSMPEIPINNTSVTALLTVENISGQNLENVGVELDLSKYNFISDVYLYEDDAPEFTFENGIFKFTIPSINTEKPFIDNIHIRINKIETATQDFSFNAKAVESGVTYLSNQLDLKLRDLTINVEAKVDSNVENNATVENGNNIEYTITVKNIGNSDTLIKIYDLIPSTYQLVQFTVNDENISVKGGIDFDTTLSAGESKIAKIILKVDTNVLEISNQIVVTVIGQSTQTFEYEYAVAQPEKDDKDPTEPDGKFDEENQNGEIIDTPKDPNENSGSGNQNPGSGESVGGNEGTTGGEPQVQTASIKGKVWLDNNRNGALDSDEELLSNVKVMLIDADKQNSYVKDKEGKILECITDNNGEYEFRVNIGNYYVIFDYDTEKYELTTYKNENVDESVNSDVKNYMIDGKLYAITDNIKTDAEYITADMGLVTLPKFDLKIENYITRTIVQNTAGTTSTDFNNSKLAKIEIPAKVLSGSTVLIEYVIKITNTGELAGNIEEIEDYLPNNISFNSEINKDWYLGTDGNVYTNVLANTSINPGESKEIKLVLTKNMTVGNVGTTKNLAQITKYSNSRQFQDVDYSNNVDYSEIMIDIKTGDVVMYISLIIASITIIAGGVFFIKKKIL